MIEVAAAVIQRPDGAFLLAQRPAGKVYAGWWEFPGGKVEPGEHPEAALVREVREELGCDVEVDRIHEVVFHAYPDFDLYMLVYASRITGGEPRAIQVAEVAWVEAKRLPELDLLPADYPLARALAASGGS